jgi:hypothetical protein
MTYPDGIDALVNVNATDSLSGGGHAARHNSVNTALEEVKDFLGTGTGYRYNSTVYFTSNGTFTKATYPWLRAIRVKCQGGGGGGGGCATTTASQVSAGVSGGGGVYAESFITDISSLSASVTVTVGSSGAGGSAGNNAGSTGGTSSFGSAVSASGGLGGGGGPGAAPVTFATATGVATTGVGDLVIAGEGSEAALYLNTGGAQSPRGGSSVLGTGAGGRLSSGPGNAGNNYGGGGSGGANTVSQGTARAGGAGAAGIVIVELYA